MKVEATKSGSMPKINMEGLNYLFESYENGALSILEEEIYKKQHRKSYLLKKKFYFWWKSFIYGYYVMGRNAQIVETHLGVIGLLNLLRPNKFKEFMFLYRLGKTMKSIKKSNRFKIINNR